jgi:uncharacterized protein (TIGR02757 family)
VTNDFAQLKKLLDAAVVRFNHPDFIVEDPISIPRKFIDRRDAEIAGFLVATFAWGNRKSILKSAHRLLEIMNFKPYDFTMRYMDYGTNSRFVHRTFQHEDLNYFFQALNLLYQEASSLEKFFLPNENEQDTFGGIQRFREAFFAFSPPLRTLRHVSNPASGSAAKRLNMYLRWMVRKDQAGVDLGLWDQYPMHKLSCPLDVHSGNVARALGLLTRKQNDRKAVQELDFSLRQLDPIDPVKYDFALFGLGVTGSIV